MRVNVPLELDLPAPVINLMLPANMPLMCDAQKAAELTGISPTTLRQLRRRHKDFPAKNVGRSVYYLMPDLYAWVRDYPGDIETE